MPTYTIKGGGGLKLHVREWGIRKAQAILLIHGWSQNHLCWSKQFESPLAADFRLVAMDIRGHGQSEAPLDAESYTTSALWADDVKNVIEALEVECPILVSWSYGGFIICDYLRMNGDDAIAGINFVAAAVGIGKQWFGTRIGPGFLTYAELCCSEDQTIALKAMRDFLHTSVVKPIAAADMELAMGLEYGRPSKGAREPDRARGGLHTRSGENKKSRYWSPTALLILSFCLQWQR